MTLFPPLPPETCRILDGIPALIDKTFPLPGRFRSTLPRDVAELSRLLTSGRGERALSYLGRPNLLSAYLRYFLPWNLYRLCRLLPSLDIPLAAGDLITDIGSGPLTFAAALWISRPALRSIPLELHCIDQSGPALEAGKAFFAALAGSGCLWKIKTIRNSIDGRGALGGRRTKTPQSPARAEKPAALVCAVNVLNEMYGGASRRYSGEPARGAARSAENAAGLLESFAAPSGSILAVEPGVPQPGEFISLLRGSLIERNRFPAAPCPHRGTCPLPGGKTRTGKNRWCHFAFETADAPKALHTLSAAAGIPKERAVLSFLLTGAAPKPENGGLTVRILSDAFPLPGGLPGRYGCSERGLVLVTGERTVMRNAHSGALVNAAFTGTEQRDPKSGALMAAL
ncbi:MAG: small ribosomal subunit Rsm22 family protein [Treponema sp.]|jgi:hypothetical protein|nr:small ribosomal subunit Rsm22 family protein [Treponema sp.]